MTGRPPRQLAEQTRAVEWLLASLMIAWGIAVSIPGNTLQLSGFRELTRLAPEEWWAFLSICIGGMRVAALWINGRWRSSPLLRAGGAIWGAGWWLGLAWLMWRGSNAGEVPTALAYYPIFTVFEFHSVARCAADSYRSGALMRFRAQAPE